MAEIDIERKRRDGWTWALAVTLLLLVVGAVWYLATAPEGRIPLPDIDRSEETRGVPPGTPPTATPRGPAPAPAPAQP
jgi:hypothetical protein